MENISKTIIPILRANNVEYAALFGSVARGEDRPGSDVDILVRYSVTPGLFKHIGLAQSLEDALKVKVDLVTENSLKQPLAANVKKDLRALYGQLQRQDLR